MFRPPWKPQPTPISTAPQTPTRPPSATQPHKHPGATHPGRSSTLMTEANSGAASGMVLQRIKLPWLLSGERGGVRGCSSENHAIRQCRCHAPELSRCHAPVTRNSQNFQSNMAHASRRRGARKSPLVSVAHLRNQPPKKSPRGHPGATHL
jgi:hypothetical protein